MCGSEWIPVGERLPEESGHYWVTFQEIRSRHQRRMREIVEFIENESWDLYHDYEVIAWMPCFMPEIYTLPKRSRKRQRVRPESKIESPIRKVLK